MNKIKIDKWNGRLKQIEKAISKHKRTVANLEREREMLIKKKDGDL